MQFLSYTGHIQILKSQMQLMANELAGAEGEFSIFTESFTGKPNKTLFMKDTWKVSYERYSHFQLLILL